MPRVQTLNDRFDAPNCCGVAGQLGDDLVQASASGNLGNQRRAVSSSVGQGQHTRDISVQCGFREGRAFYRFIATLVGPFVNRTSIPTRTIFARRWVSQLAKGPQPRAAQLSSTR
ncbi:MAG TPA: hypothetical protein VMV94_14770 [Phycisphaerae bacterium]|nr:hypothetical protein [Phycisphaerae bacterium]